MRLILISDTHCQHDFKIPEGDILIHAGDLTFNGTVPEITKEVQWLRGVKVGLGFQHVVVVPGNHDWLAEKDPALMELLFRENGLTYLQHKAAEIDGLKFFGSGYTPRFFDWALNVDRGEPLRALWSQIPKGTNVLITHGPPYDRFDTVNRPDGDADSTFYGITPRERIIPAKVGCWDLAHRIQDLVPELRLHVFGHIHQSGIATGADGVIYANSSICNEQYRAAHAPHIVDL